MKIFQVGWFVCKWHPHFDVVVQAARRQHRQMWMRFQDVDLKDEKIGQVRDEKIGQMRDEKIGQVRDEKIGQMAGMRDEKIGQVRDEKCCENSSPFNCFKLYFIIVLL